MKKFDLKSIITFSLIITLIIITLALVAAVICGQLSVDNALVNAIAIVLFSNSTTMVMTFYFSKKKDETNDSEEGE